MTENMNLGRPYPPVPRDNPQGRLIAIYVALELASRLDVRQVWHGLCPECGNPVFAERANWNVVCGFCGNGPFRLKLKSGPKQLRQRRA